MAFLQFCLHGSSWNVVLLILHRIISPQWLLNGKNEDTKLNTIKQLRIQIVLMPYKHASFLKLFRTPRIRSQHELLQHLITWWDVDHQLFIIVDQELEIYVVDIYFITSLSRRGEQVQLSGSRAVRESINTLISRYFSGTKKTQSGKININTITNIPLWIILHTMVQVAGA